MSETPKSFSDVIGLWPSRFEMASDIGANPEAVRKWQERKSIPTDWWFSILRTETARRAGLSADLLAALAAKAPLDDLVIPEVRA